jgi:hypothetical protein
MIKDGVYRREIDARRAAEQYANRHADTEFSHFPKEHMYVAFTEYPHGSMGRREFKYRDVQNWCAYDGGKANQLESYHCIAPNLALAESCKHFAYNHGHSKHRCVWMEAARYCSSTEAQGEAFRYGTQLAKGNKKVETDIEAMERFIEEGKL